MSKTQNPCPAGPEMPLEKQGRIKINNQNPLPYVVISARRAQKQCNGWAGRWQGVRQGGSLVKILKK